MRLINLLLLLFIMSAFAVGVSWQGNDMILFEEFEEKLDNVSQIGKAIVFEKTGDNYIDGMFVVLKEFIDFAIVSFTEVMRLGILFGTENPQYFEAEFIFAIIKLLVWLAILSLLIQPLFYLIVFIIMAAMWIKDRITKKNKHKRKLLNE